MSDAFEAAPPLWGLVLAGGQSRRMGGDKALIEYHDAPQALWAQALLATLCERAYVSIGAAQVVSGRYGAVPHIVDTEAGGGPAAGLAAAWAMAPTVAWLTVAADMPLLDASTLRRLIDARDPGRAATAFQNDEGRIEPLCAIWEPSIRGAVRSGLSLRAVLEQAGAKVCRPDEPERLRSANTPAEAAALRKALTDGPAEIGSKHMK